MFKLLVVSIACFALLVQPAHSVGLGSVADITSASLDAVRDIVSIVPKMIRAKTAAVVTGAADMASIFTTGLGLSIRALAKASSSMTNAGADGIISVGDTISQTGDSISRSLAGNLKSVPREVRVLLKTPVLEEIKMSPVVVENVKMSPVLIEEDIKMAPVVVEEDFKMSPVFVERAKMTPVLVEEVKAAPAVKVVEEEIVVPCEQEIVEVPVESYPIRTVHVKSRPSTTFVETSARFIPDKVSSVWDVLRHAAESKANTISQILNIGGSNGRSRAYEIVDTARHQGPLIETFQIVKK